MKFLANENFPGIAVEALRARGHDIAWIKTDAPGSNDRAVLSRAVSENRILLTFDKDFGELAFREKLPISCGVVLFRISPRSPLHVAHAAVTILESRSDWEGHFAVIQEHRIRMIELSSDGN
jgi:predicted nuclease of predicted toxin-antitoxin system